MLQLPCLAAVVVTLMASCASGDTGYFWHVTDFHYDFTYWDHQLSCNNNVTNPGPLGDYWCDSPWRLVTDTIAAMGDIKSDVDFLIWTGDTVAHIEDEHLNVSLNMEIMQNLTDALDSGFPNKTIYATFGNHDYHPTNQFPATGSEIYNRTAEMWKKWIQEEEQMNNFRKGGYYTKSIWPNLRIVGLNTNLYYTSDKVTVNIPDPTGQLAWLSQTLQNAKNKTEKVIVTAHIPPGVHTPSRVVWFQEAFVAPFMTIISNFSDIIVGMHFGHDHHDGFKVFYDSQGQPAVPLFVAPSVTPWRYKLKTGEIGPPHNPAVRLVSFDRTSGKHLNIQQYRLDLPQGNLQKKANFTLLYNFTQQYQVNDITAASLHELTVRMKRVNSEGDQLVNDYYRFTTADAVQEDSAKTCDSVCQSRIRCGLTDHLMGSFDACVAKYTTDTSASHNLISVDLVLLLLMTCLSMELFFN
ncbi:acid sphingomyelinase-like phosphodiesterase 3b [Pomacea canaliculata]|uniref:acid sphingomyelinase-like phosphodiesterase 3b n=1 Tax=Pomacea canaliculata TaxID=400727 RepID=UPI000D729EB9|nr:acid sphingomyelinase-like phosphodiesterase 3b [Pomacea canaliculata]